MRNLNLTHTGLCYMWSIEKKKKKRERERARIGIKLYLVESWAEDKEEAKKRMQLDWEKWQIKYCRIFQLARNGL